ncbi:MAG: phage major capsid protein [Clostridia bacterium]|nr:phage major capsid protein [Clostridia bacterium]MBR0470019.1 phage major capsid protein [Clostridia bacterium]
MLKSLQMKQKLQSMRDEAQALLDENKIDEAKAKMQEINALKDAIVMQEELEQLQKDEAAGKITEQENPEAKATAHQNANIIRAILKKVTNQSLTEAENALLLPTTTNTDGEHGEGYLLPQEVQTTIHEKIRAYNSIRDIIGYMPSGALTGSYPIENFETVSELVDFTDGTDGVDGDDISFTNIKYTLREKAAFVKISNTLLALSDTSLIEYVSRIFAKKAVVTENNMAITELKRGKTAKKLTGWKDLKSSLNKDIDPGMYFDTCILTNQDGFDFLDSALDDTGRPVLQPDPTNATRKFFAGYPVYVFSNSMLPSVSGKPPVFYGNLKEAANIIDLDGKIMFAASSEAGFWSNTTVARLIEFVDVEQNDSSDKCYIYGTLSAATGA